MSKRVILINAFTVPVEDSQRFLERWSDDARVMARQPGMVRARMHRALRAGAQPRFVNVAEWESRQALHNASATPEFRASTQRMRDDHGLHVSAHPVVYELAVEVGPDRTP